MFQPQFHCTRFAILAVLLCLGLQITASADDYAYEVTSSAQFGIIDLTTGAFAQLGNTGVALIGLGTYGGTVYGVDANPNGSYFYWVDSTNGALHQIGHARFRYRGFGSTTTGLYGFDQSMNLYSIDPATGHPTLVGPTGLSNPSGFGVSAGSPYLYITPTAAGSRNTELYLVNTTMGAATPLGFTGFYGSGGSVVVNGTLYAGVFSPLAVYKFNDQTGQFNFVANVSGTRSYFYGLAPIFPQESPTGIQNVVTFDALNVSNIVPCPGTSGNSCFSIQQNFYLAAPANPGIPALWVQNAFFVRQLSNGGWEVAHQYFVWQSDENGGAALLGTLPLATDWLCYVDDTLPCTWVEWPTTAPLSLESQLYGGVLTLQASMGTTDLQPFSYRPPRGSVIMAPPVDKPHKLEPQLMMVGYGNVSCAKFSNTLGTVLTQVESDQQIWQPPGTGYANESCSSTGEWSSGLYWYVPAGGALSIFTNGGYPAAQGVVFTPELGASFLAVCQSTPTSCPVD